MTAATEQNDSTHTAHHSAKNDQLSLSILPFIRIKKKERKFLLSLLLAKGTYFSVFYKKTKVIIEHKGIAPGSNSILPKGSEVINKHLLTNHAASHFLSEMANVVQIQEIIKP